MNCVNSCNNDSICSAVCNRQYDENIKNCPCNEGCPLGCPCPIYLCPKSIEILVLVVNIESKKTSNYRPPKKVIWSKAGGREGTDALLTDFKGSNNQIDWSNDMDASAYGLCSFIFKDQIYFLGQVFFNFYLFIAETQENTHERSTNPANTRNQISRVENNSLKRVGSLNTEMSGATCTTTSDLIIICFRAASYDECFTVG